jgi:uncharacterized protein (TIGR00290 family)
VGSDGVLVSWSSGKDCALALYETLRDPGQRVAALLTTLCDDGECVGMHNVPRALVERQAASLGLPIETVALSPDAPPEEYAERMRRTLARHAEAGVRAVVFGDILLDDLRQQRERNLAQAGMTGLFPLWKRDTQALVRAFIELGFKAIVTNVDTAALDRTFLGRALDGQFLADLPDSVDPCGEYGEYHTFVHDGPIFRQPVRFSITGTGSVEDRYLHCNLSPEE